eukprot:CAMPEP_0194346358 /NCGR_PEP_ID=MMETSP0171-20130528/105381_1 /TAXON_ID=218684 /ORGANISM="Corethron pennatum, Strain L29A3" /LENGTH=266 /DNA_ID=CAMNT_0039113469 /DNA_START=416 /DNA_END=1213 /DNA_ORIENTATION=-
MDGNYFQNVNNIKNYSSSALKKRRMNPNVKDGQFSVYDLFRFKDLIGTGGFSSVYAVSCNYSNSKSTLAIKVLEDSRMKTESEQKHFRNELKIMRSLHHPNIIKLNGYFKESNKHYLVMEYIPGGDLLDNIIKNGSYDEFRGRKIAYSLLNAVKYMHSNGIAHRDLKPENILLSKHHECDIKIADFGLSTRFNGPKSLTTMCGTPGYIAPEVLNGKRYDAAADIWSLGVTIYIIFAGYQPFQEEDDERKLLQIKRGDYSFPKQFRW